MALLLSRQAKAHLTTLLIPVAAVLLCNTGAIPFTTSNPSVVAFLFVAFLFTLNVCIYNAYNVFPNPKAPQGLDPEMLDKLPVVKYNEIREFRGSYGELKCSICFEDFDVNDELRLSPYCPHVHHRSCIDEWLLRSVHCPYCQADFSEENEMEESKVEVFDETSRRENWRHWRWHSSGNEGGERDGEALAGESGRRFARILSIGRGGGKCEGLQPPEVKVEIYLVKNTDQLVGRPAAL